MSGGSNIALSTSIYCNLIVPQHIEVMNLDRRI